MPALLAVGAWSSTTAAAERQRQEAGHVCRYAGGVSGPPDTTPGDVYGQGAVSIRFVLSPSGKVIKKAR